MMWPQTLSVTLATAALLSIGAGSQQPHESTPNAATTYEAFMGVPQDQRAARFAALAPEDQALVVRTHAERWLEQNRRRLSAGQVALVQRAIAFVTPALYRTPNDPALVERSQALEAELACSLRQSDVREAFGALRSPVPRASGFEDLGTWFERCIVG